MVKEKINHKSNNRKRSYIQLILGLSIILLLNVFVSKIYLRFDLTAEKRYTLSKGSIAVLKQLDEYAFFKVYLDGDFPAGFKKLQGETQDMLEEFKAYSPFIEYTFINPSGISDNTKREALIQEIVNKGLQPTNLHINNKEGSSRLLIFPGIVLSYKGYEIPIELLITQKGISPERVLNNSIESLEYNLASALSKLVNDKKPTLAFLEGHGELQGLTIADIAQSLSEFFIVGKLRIHDRMSSLFAVDTINGKILDKPVIDALVIAQPTQAFSEADKYVIDQFIMHGGKVLWLIDPVFANLDSLHGNSRTIALNNELNIEDQLFKYGVRLNSTLLMDLNSRSIPIVTGMLGSQPQQELLPWLYFPVLTPQSEHPIVRNLNSIMTEFPSTLDTLNVAHIKKTILLQSSLYSRIVATPAIIDLKMLEEKPDGSLYNLPPQAIAVLLEGQFQSLYANRIPPTLKDDYFALAKKEFSVNNAMIVSSDGDLIKNQIHYTQHYPLPLGFDQFTNQTYGNKDFILNSTNYLTQENGLINIRSREITLRLLDKTRVSEDILYIQFINFILPLLIIALMALLLNYRRKMKYTVK